MPNSDRRNSPAMRKASITPPAISTLLRAMRARSTAVAVAVSGTNNATVPIGSIVTRSIRKSRPIWCSIAMIFAHATDSARGAHSRGTGEDLRGADHGEGARRLVDDAAEDRWRRHSLHVFRRLQSANEAERARSIAPGRVAMHRRTSELAGQHVPVLAERSQRRDAGDVHAGLRPRAVE